MRTTIKADSTGNATRPSLPSTGCRKPKSSTDPAARPRTRPIPAPINRVTPLRPPRAAPGRSHPVRVRDRVATIRPKTTDIRAVASTNRDPVTRTDGLKSPSDPSREAAVRSQVDATRAPSKPSSEPVQAPILPAVLIRSPRGTGS